MRNIILAGFMSKIAEDNKEKQRISSSLKSIVKREATKSTITEMGPEAMEAIRDLKKKELLAGTISTPLGLIGGRIAGEVAGHTLQQALLPALMKIPDPIQMPARFAEHVLSRGALPVAAMVGGGVLGYRLGQAYFRATMPQEGVEAQRKYKETFDRYYHDPEFREDLKNKIQERAMGL
jgi:hypothetical protein